MNQTTLTGPSEGIPAKRKRVRRLADYSDTEQPEERPTKKVQIDKKTRKKIVYVFVLCLTKN